MISKKLSTMSGFLRACAALLLVAAGTQLTAQTLTCPANQTRPVTPGSCFAQNPSLPAPTVSGVNGVIQNVVFEPFGAQPAGWTTSSAQAGLFNFNENGWLGTDVLNVNFNGPYCSIDDDDAGAGFVGNGTITSPVYNLSTVALGAGQSLWLLFDWQHQPIGTSGNMIAQTSLDGGTTWTNCCNFLRDQSSKGFVAQQLTPAASSQFRFRFTHEDEGAWGWGAGIDNFRIAVIGAATAANVTTTFSPAVVGNNFPVGNTTVTHSIPNVLTVCQAQNTTGQITVAPTSGVQNLTCSYNLLVQDTDPPVFTNCQSNVTFNLAPGECGLSYTYPCITATDCGSWTLFSGFASNTNDPWSQNGQHSSYFNVTNIGTQPIQVTSVLYKMWNNQVALNTFTCQVFNTAVGVSAVGNQLNAGAWTLNTTQSVTMLPQGIANLVPQDILITLSTPLTLGPGQFRALSFHSGALGQYGGGPFTTQNGGPAFQDTRLRVSDGFLSSANFGGTLFGPNQTPYCRVNYNAVGSTVDHCGQPNIVVAAPGTPASGDFIHKDDSPITFTYTVADPNNPALVRTCSWQVTVNEYAPALTSLACNDLVEISLDATCQHTIGADEVLEGGPYGCYDDYIVQVDKIAPYGNGPWVAANLGPADINKTYGVKVTDPDTGNSCWGLVKIEDKLAPVLSCADINVPCNAVITPGSPISGTLVANSVFPIAAAGASQGTTNVALPVGAVVTDVNVGNVHNHTWVSDISARVQSPGGVSVNLYDRPGIPIPGDCANDGMDVILDDDVAATNAQLDAQCANNPAVFGSYQPINPLSVYDGQNLNGTWTFVVSDIVGGDGATSNVFTLFITYNASVPFPNLLTLNQNVFLTGTRTYRVTAGAGTPVMENCSDVTLSYIDTETPLACATGFYKTVSRKWTAVDASGNTSTCTQVFNFTRPALGDVVLPPDYDDIDEPAFNCGIAYPTPQNIQNGGLQGFPWIAGRPDGCTIGWNYEDLVVDVCDGTYKIRRKWTIIDWCTGDEIEHNQIVKVIDDAGPSWTCPANLTVSTDPFDCCATVNLPDAIVEDGCSRIKSVSAMVIGKDCDGQVLGMFTYDGVLRNFPGNNFWDLDTLAVFNNTGCLPLGKHDVIYTAIDDCGNSTTCQFTLTVLDLQPPQVNCVEYTVVTVGYDDPNDCYLQDPLSCEFAGVSWVDAEVFNKGSFDNCGDIYYTIRRMPTDTTITGNFGQVTFNSFIDTLNQQHGEPNASRCNDQFTVDFPVTEYQQATGLTSPFINLNFNYPVYPFPQGLPQNHPYPAGAGYETLDAVTYQGCTVFPDYPLVGRDSIKFYCDEVGTEQIVILRGYQIDYQGRLQLDANGEPVYNECMVEVEVQDKIRPTCIAPANVTVSCEAFDPSLWAYGYPQVWDNCCLDTSYKIVTGIATYKGITETRNYSLFDTLCNRGTITRTWRAYDCNGQTNQCTQRVFVNYNQDYHIRFPNDRVVFECDGTTAFGEPVINKKDCELIAISYVDQVFTVVPDACYKIERLWTIQNWCTYDPNQPCIYVDNPNPNSLPNASANLQGPTVSPNGTPAPWNPSSVALTPGGPVKNFADYWQANANCYQYKQIIKVIDNEKPVIDSWELDDCDLTANDPLFWNGMNWWDPIHQTHDLCEAPVRISLTGLDSCSGSNVDIRALIFLDLNGDNIMETVLNTNNTNFTPTVPNGFIYYNNYQNPNYGINGPNGQLIEFDHRPVLPQLKYRFAVRDQVIGGKRKLSVMWTDRANPNPNNNGDWVLPQIPLGKHKIKWFVEDNCGNETVWESPWNLRDCKAPTVVCFNGLSVNIMPTGMITIWGSDFLQYGEDNCTPADQLVYSIRKSGTGTGFPVDANGNPIPGVTFTCAELGTQYVELWAKDKAGNASYCETYVIVQDPGGVNCSNTPRATVAGDLKTEKVEGLEDATVGITLVNPNPGQPALNQFSDAQGHYQFSNAIPVSNNFTITPVKDDNPLNGVSTYDLLLMSKHILGVEPLNSPYKMIAADVNKSGSITSFDILELRKLILGIYTDLPNNTSWRFVDKSYTFPNPANPFAAAFPEEIAVANIQADLMNGNFYAVKVGDVNNNAVANNLMSADDRTAGTLMFDVQDQTVKAGEEFTVNFKAAEKVLGYQFTMNYNNLEVVDVIGGAGMKAENFAVFAKEGALTTSFDGETQGEFSVKFRATAAGQISKMIGVSSRITKAEAYTANADRYEVAFRFNNNGQTTIAGVGFELYQNQPNPFINKTVIGFNLPEATEATLTIYDETGRVLFTQKGDFAKGNNAISIDRAVLNTTGLMYYKLETATDSASKKMIQTK